MTAAPIDTQARCGRLTLQPLHMPMLIVRRAAVLVAALMCVAPVLPAQQRGRVRGDTAHTQRPQRRANAPRRDTTQADTTHTKAVDPLTRFVESFTYRNLGPAAYSGRVTSIAVPEPYSRHHTIYIGSAGGGVWKTSNAGITWHSLGGDSIGVTTIGDVAVAPSDTSIVWVGTGERNSLRSQMWGDGVYKSTDGGKTWHKMGLRDTKTIGAIVIDPHDPNTVYVGALGALWATNPERGVFKTTDGGKTWSKILYVDDTTGVIDLAMDPTNASVLYAATWHRLRWGGGRMEGAGTGSGIYKTTDAGKTWKKLTDSTLHNGLPTSRMGRIGLSISREDPNVIYAMIEVDRGIVNTEAQPYGGVFRSSDGGATWTHVNDVQANPHYYYDRIVADPTDTGHVYVLASPLLESKDGGKSFAPDSLHLVHVDNHAMWIDPGDAKHLLLGNDGGLYESFDGGNAWAHMQLPIGQFYSVIVDSSQTPYGVCGGLQDNGVWCGPSRTRDSAGVTDADWYSVNGGDGMWVQIPANDPAIVYSEYQFGNVSKLNLRTWERTLIQPQSLDAGVNSGYELRWGWTTPLLLSQRDTGVLYVGANHFIRMTNGGKDWRILGPDMTRGNRDHPAPDTGYTSYHAIFSIAESPRTAAILWTGSDDGLVWVSRDTGRTWSNVTGNFPKGAPTTCWVSTIAASYHAEGTAYLTYDCHFHGDDRPHVYRTENFGKSWTAIDAGLPPRSGSFTIFESPANARVLWVGTETGAYVTLDGGAHWHRFGKNLPPVPVERFAMSYRTHDLVVATHGRGLWVVNVAPMEAWSDSLLGETAHLFPVPPALQYRYSDTYPSFGSQPFVAPNPPRGAEISYYLKDAQPGSVKLVITSAAGDTVKHLSGPGYSGVQHVVWDLTRDTPRPRELGGPITRAELRRVEPGDYMVHLTVGTLKLEQPITVTAWPVDRLGRVR